MTTLTRMMPKRYVVSFLAHGRDSLLTCLHGEKAPKPKLKSKAKAGKLTEASDNEEDGDDDDGANGEAKKVKFFLPFSRLQH